MPSGNLVTASTPATVAEQNLNEARLVTVIGTTHVAFFTGNAGLAYATSTNAGSTWSGQTSLISAGSTINVDSLAVVGSTLYTFGKDFALSGQIAFDQWTFSAGSFGAKTEFIFQADATTNPIAQVTAAWDSANGVWHVAYARILGQVRLCTVTNAGVLTNGSTGFTASTPNVYDIACIPVLNASKILVTYTTSTLLQVLSTTFNGAAYAGNALESTGIATPSWAAAALDNGNLLDIVYQQGSNLYAIKRTGSNAYSAPINIASGASTANKPFTLTPDGAGGLHVYYTSNASQANGEIYSIYRTGAGWAPATLFAGGDAGGYSIPRAAAVPITSAVDVTYQTGTAAPFAIYWKSSTQGSTPNQPTNVSPVSGSNIGTLTPTFTWTYSNPTAGDTQSAYELKVAVSGGAQVFDSGKVISTAQSVTYAGPALSYGTTYTFQVSTWDSLLAPTSQSAYSSTTTFTPQTPATATITSILDNGTTFNATPAAITSPTMDVTFSYSQASAHAMRSYLLTVYQSDGATLFAQSGTPAGTFTTLSLASGSSTTTPDFTPALVSGTTYVLTVTVTDNVTSTTSVSSPWTLNYTAAPPTAPSAFTALTGTTQNDLGAVQLAWTNGGSTVSNNVYRRPAGTVTWTQIAPPTLRTSLQDFSAVPLVAYDYGVQGVNSAGATSTITTVTNVTLGMKQGRFGHWLNDSTNPLTSVALGAMAVSGVAQASTWTHHEDANRFVPSGRSAPIVSYGLADWWDTTGRVYIVPSVVQTAALTVTAAQVIAALTAMVQAHTVLLYRSPSGVSRWVVIENLSTALIDQVNYSVTFDLVQTSYSAVSLVL